MKIGRVHFFLMGLMAGVAVWAVVHSIAQDLLGLEGYLELVRSTWVDPRWTLPWEILLLVLIAIGIAATHRIATKTDALLDREVHLAVNLRVPGRVSSAEVASAISEAIERTNRVVGWSSDGRPVYSSTTEVDAHSTEPTSNRTSRSR